MLTADPVVFYLLFNKIISKNEKSITKHNQVLIAYLLQQQVVCTTTRPVTEKDHRKFKTEKRVADATGQTRKMHNHYKIPGVAVSAVSSV